MKKILLVLLTTISLTCFAADFSLNISKNDNGETVIVYDENDWMIAKHEGDYNLYVNKGGFPVRKDGVIRFHSLLIFDKEKQMRGTNLTVSKIYSYGFIDCKSAVFSLMGSIYVNVQDVAVFHEKHQEGEFLVDLNNPGTARYDAFLIACSKASI